MILGELTKLKNPERALQDQKYHKSSREHWGISAPVRDSIIRTFTKDLAENEIITTAKTLWETDLFDPMMCAAKMLSLKKVKPSSKLWALLLDFLKKVDGWALEDTLANTAWKCILKDETLLDQLEVWTKHPNFWMRRAALVYTLPYAKPGRNPERMLTWAGFYANDPEWFIQKAIGWWLRDLGEHNEPRVVQFLKIHWKSLKGVARKEATRKLTSTFEL